MVSRADKAEAAGRDVSTVRTAVSGAEAAIASARDTTVAAQAAKTYAIEVTTEETGERQGDAYGASRCGDDARADSASE